MAKNKESRSNLSDQVYYKIKNLIMRYEIVPGQRLHMQDICEKLGVSRTPLREALARLAQEGYITLIPNKGCYVNEINIDEAGELYDVREILEGYTVEKAIEKSTDDALKRLEARLKGYDEDVKKKFTRERLLKDRDIHLFIADTAGNKTIRRMLEQVFERIIFKRSTEGIYSRERGQAASREHREIFEAMKQKDARKASDAIKEHIRRGKNNIVQDLRERDEIRKYSHHDYSA